MTKAEAGRKGGKATFKKYGSSHMSKIGKKGYAATAKKYKLVAWGTSDFAFIDRTTGNPVAFLSGRKVA